MSTKKRRRGNNRNSLADRSLEKASEPQGLKPSSLLNAHGTAESRALPKPRAESRQSEAESRRPDVVAVADRLHSAAIHLLRRVRRQDVATGEGPARLSALSVLVFAGAKTLGELASAEQVKPPTMSRIVAGLARDHLIDIATDPQDARRMHIRATAKGKSILHKGRDRRIVYLAAHLDRLTSEELRMLGDAAKILDRALRDWD